MRIFFSEICRVFRNRIFISFFLILFVLNAFFMYNSQVNSDDVEFISADAKITLNEDIRKLPVDERIDFLQQKTDNIYESDYVSYTNSSYTERLLLNNTMSYLYIVNDYEGYVQSVIDKSESITDFAVFSDNSYSFANAKKTGDDFKHLYSVDTSYDVSDGVNSASEFRLTDFLVLVIVFVICDVLVGADRIINITGLLKSCKYGRLKLILSKTAAVIFSTLAVSGLFYGINFLISSSLYGIGDLSRSIQSVNGFENCLLKIDVLAYILLFVFSKLLLMAGLALLICLFTLISKSRIEVYAWTFIIAFVFTLLVLFIDDNSDMMWMKYLNPIAFLDVKTALGSYRNINLFGIPVGYCFLFFVILVAAVIIFSILDVYMFITKNNWGYNKNKTKSIIKIKSPLEKSSVIRHEIYKHLVFNKTVWILLLVVAFQIGSVFFSPMRLSEDEKFEKFFYQTLGGELSGENEEKIKEMIDNTETQKEKDNVDKYVVPYYEYLSEQKQAGNNVSVVFYNGYNKLFGIDSQTCDFHTLLLYILLLITTVPLFVNDYEIKSIPLLCATKTGIRKINLLKFICSIITTIAINLIVYLPFIYKVYCTYGFNGLNNTLISIPEFSDASANITIIQALIFVFAIRLLVSIICGIIIGAISLITKNNLTSAAISILLLIVPLILPLSGIDFLNNYSLYYLQTFSQILMMGVL